MGSASNRIKAPSWAQWAWTWTAWALDFVGLDPGIHAQIIFLGLDGAWKSTLMRVLETRMIPAPDPSRHATTTRFRLGRLLVEAQDVPGHGQALETWSQFLWGADGALFVCDLDDPERWPLARIQLDLIIGFLADNQIDLPMAVVGNKLDLVPEGDRDMRKRAFRESLGLGSKDPDGVRVFWSSQLWLQDPRYPGPEPALAWIETQLE